MIPPHADWQIETDPRGLLALATTANVSTRKLRLCVCACLRCALAGGPNADEAQALAFAEQVADDEVNVDPGEWAAVRGAWTARRRVASSGPFDASVWLVSAIGENVHQDARRLMEGFKEAGFRDTILLRLMREIFGNPFLPVDFTPWRTGTTTALAQGMYEAHDFSATPILADALQDAGCDDTDVLAHCRDPHAAHVRGCWVVDGVLGKT